MTINVIFSCLPAILWGCLLPPYKNTWKPQSADCSHNNRVSHSKKDRFWGAQSPAYGQPALPPSSTKQQFHIMRCRWYLWADVLGVTSIPQEAGERAAWAWCSRIILRAVFHLAGPCYGPLRVSPKDRYGASARTRKIGCCTSTRSLLFPLKIHIF